MTLVCFPLQLAIAPFAMAEFTASDFSGKRGEPEEAEVDKMYKIVLVGDSGVGKSNLLKRFTKDEFSFDSKSTIGVEFATKVLRIKDKVIKVQLWDTAGQERFRAMTGTYYKKARGALIVYDITSKESFDSVKKWLEEVQNNERTDSEEPIVRLIIGNKSDRADQRAVETETAMEFAKEHEVSFLETSAMAAIGVDEAFRELISQIYKKDSASREKPLKKNNAKGGAALGGGESLMPKTAAKKSGTVSLGAKKGAKKDASKEKCC